MEITSDRDWETKKAELKSMHEQEQGVMLLEKLSMADII